MLLLKQWLLVDPLGLILMPSILAHSLSYKLDHLRMNFLKKYHCCCHQLEPGYLTSLGWLLSGHLEMIVV